MPCEVPESKFILPARCGKPRAEKLTKISPGLLVPMGHLAEANAKLLRNDALRTQAQWEISSA